MTVQNDFDLTTPRGCKKALQRAQKEISRDPSKKEKLQGLIKDAQWCLEILLKKRRRNLLQEEEIFWSKGKRHYL